MRQSNRIIGPVWTHFWTRFRFRKRKNEIRISGTQGGEKAQTPRNYSIFATFVCSNAKMMTDGKGVRIPYAPPSIKPGESTLSWLFLVPKYTLNHTLWVSFRCASDCIWVNAAFPDPLRQVPHMKFQGPVLPRWCPAAIARLCRATHVHDVDYMVKTLSTSAGIAVISLGSQSMPATGIFSIR